MIVVKSQLWENGGLVPSLLEQIPSKKYVMPSEGILPNGFGFTPETKKFRPDAQTQNCRTRARSKTELKRSVTEEMGECSIETSKKSKCQNYNEGHSSEPKAKALQPLVLPGHVENKFKVEENVEVDELPSLSPDEGSEAASTQKEMRLTLANAIDKEMCKTSSYCSERIESIEMDTIIASGVRDHPITPNPSQMPQDYIDCQPRDQPSAPSGLIIKTDPKPDQKSVITIPHAYQTDTEAGDYFGATLYTYTRPSGKKYKYQHLLKDIIDGYPAQKMRIREGDELVLIGQTFTPDLNHTEILNSFHHDVKVDGKTRFSLVLRKSEKKKSSWYWYETSAILSPDPKQHPHTEVPIVKDLKIGPAKTTRVTQKIVFSIYDSSLYMFIDQSGIHGVPIERVDRPKYVNKTVEISFNPLARKAALFGMDGTSYVSLDVRTDGQRDIRISNEEKCTWFEYEATGVDNKFHVNDCFLAYDKVENKFVMSKIKEGRNCVIFQDVGRVKGIDHPDYACASELANMDAEEIEDPDSAYASKVGSQEKDTWTLDDDDPKSPIFLSADNLDMD
ncbi:uncharacterized protein LOC127833537 isoform X2 [Dreissena polymorpha]|nr:uncharacterized protein LOC127833537 isoform X2 [Dreissena polymorpha]